MRFDCTLWHDCFDHLHLSLNRGVYSGTTDDVTTSFLHFSMFSAALWNFANSRPVHSLMLSSHFFFCLPCLLPPFTVPCDMVLARPDERETCLLTSSKTRCHCSPVDLFSTYVFCAEDWWENNSRLVRSIVKTMGHETTRTVFYSDQSPDGCWNNCCFGILTGLWPETNRNVHRWCDFCTLQNSNFNPALPMRHVANACSHLTRLNKD